MARAFALLWWTLGLALLAASARTASHALAEGTAAGAHVALLGAFEGASALLFLIPRTMRLGALGLLASFAVAFVAHALQMQLRWDLLVYAAAVYFVAVHGPVVPGTRESAAAP